MDCRIKTMSSRTKKALSERMCSLTAARIPRVEMMQAKNPIPVSPPKTYGAVAPSASS